MLHQQPLFLSIIYLVALLYFCLLFIARRLCILDYGERHRPELLQEPHPDGPLRHSSRMCGTVCGQRLDRQASVSALSIALM